VFLVLVVAAVFPEWLVSGNPLEASAREAFRAPSTAHWFGTDENGRDVLTRLVHGTGVSLFTGFAATLFALVVGTLLGAIAGSGPGILDGFLMRFVEVLLAFPEILLALVICTFWGRGILNAVVAVGVASVPALCEAHEGANACGS